jgi:hypothetical protein
MIRLTQLVFASSVAAVAFQLVALRAFSVHLNGSSALPEGLGPPRVQLQGNVRQNLPSKQSAVNVTSRVISLPDRNTFSACLLVMDDNHKLPEWLAYHYHALPLRHLVVAVDPQSVTSPSKILDRWRQQGMTIEEWTDEEIDVASWHKNESALYDTLDAELKRDHHRLRQRRFYGTCSKHLKDHGRAWTIYIDSDEYLVFNGPANQTNHNLTNTPYPSVQESGAVIKYLQDQMKRNNTNSYWRKPCIGIPRTLFGTKEGDKKKRKSIPQGFNDTTFDTLRYSKHTGRNVESLQHTGMGKCMVDLSRVPRDWIGSYAPTAHRPIKSVCSPPWVHDEDTAFRINHYTGSREAFAYRQDARMFAKVGTAEKEFERRSRFADIDDDNIRPWLDGFVQEHGHERALQLLEGAGVLEPKTQPYKRQ